MRVLTAAIAMAAGLIVLLGYFYPLETLTQLRIMLTDWAVIIAAMAVLVGIANLIFVQMEKIRKREKNSIYGVLLVLSLIITFGLGLVFGPENQYMQLAVDAIIVPVEGSLMAILAITLVYASIRLFRRRKDVMTVIFLFVAVLFLFVTMPTPFGPVLGGLNDYILQFLGMFSRGGARGLLIGIALGTLLTGLRVLFGIDRPYGGN
jgi:ABC-type transport system involved in cytochrome c biogenesis permease subunit